MLLLVVGGLWKLSTTHQEKAAPREFVTPPADTVTVPAPATTTLPSTVPSTPPKVSELAPRPALDLTRIIFDAHARARGWKKNAVLAGFRLEIEGGAPVSAVELEFAESRGPAVPGAPLGGDRLFVIAHAGSLDERAAKVSTAGRSLPDPNCPFDVAFSKLVQTGTPRESRIVGEYQYSERHARAVYAFTPAGGKTRFIDADQCQVLVR